MNAADIVTAIAATGGMLTMIDGRLTYAGPRPVREAWAGRIAERRPEIIAALAGASTHTELHCDAPEPSYAAAEAFGGPTGAACFREWSVHWLNRDSMNVVYSPPACLAEVLATYPHAIAAEPMSERTSRAATEAESDELRLLIESVLVDAPDEWDDVHRIACADADAAFTCWRELRES